MKHSGTWKRLAGGRMAAALTLTGALLAASSGVLNAESDSSGDHGLVGTWTIQVTLRDCATNAPLGPPFNSLVTFHKGGTLSESTVSLPGERTSGHGTWYRVGGHTYEQKMIALMLFDTPGNLPGTPTYNPALPIAPPFFAGWVTVSHILTLNEPDLATSVGTNAFYKLDGTRYRTGCSTAAAQRFE
jgi:hypothetical protein